MNFLKRAWLSLIAKKRALSIINSGNISNYVIRAGGDVNP